MFKALKSKALLVYGMVVSTGLAAGAAWAGCNGNYCTADIYNCFPVNSYTTDTCCIDADSDGVKHCAQCSRQHYKCGTQFKLGPAFDCKNPGDRCC